MESEARGRINSSEIFSSQRTRTTAPSSREDSMPSESGSAKGKRMQGRRGTSLLPSQPGKRKTICFTAKRIF